MKKKLTVAAGLALMIFGMVTIIGIRATSIDMTEGQILVQYWRALLTSVLFILGGAALMQRSI